MKHSSITPADPNHGLPGPLPEGEEILWQGAPNWRALARSAFHTRVLLVYFGAILAARGATSWSNEHALGAAVIATLWLVPLAAIAMGVLYTMAWLTARTTVYTITNKRLVMRIGVVLDLTLNLPFESIESAGLHVARDQTGDLPLALVASNKIAYAHLWPHARPWRLKHPEPMLRAVPDAVHVGTVLSNALAAVVSGTQNAPAKTVAAAGSPARVEVRPMAAAS